MPRFKLTVEYDGSPFVGWQRQNNGVGVQHLIEQALKAFSGETVTVYGAGRTDSGVHALGQVAHFDLSGCWQPGRIRDALNAHIRPFPISILLAEAVDERFDARFSALERCYEYRILNRRAPPTVDLGRVWWVPTPLDGDAMAEAGRVLIGCHDFSSFRATGCQAKSPIKTLDELLITRLNDTILVAVRARSFLYRQVRNIVGALAFVGQGRWSEDDLVTALEARDRSASGPTAPAEGLFLVSVHY